MLPHRQCKRKCLTSCYKAANYPFHSRSSDKIRMSWKSPDSALDTSAPARRNHRCSSSCIQRSHWQTLCWPHLASLSHVDQNLPKDHCIRACSRHFGTPPGLLEKTTWWCPRWSRENCQKSQKLYSRSMHSSLTGSRSTCRSWYPQQGSKGHSPTGWHWNLKHSSSPAKMESSSPRRSP